MKPIRNQILFKPFMQDEITQYGLFVPESYRKHSDKGEILAVGDGTKERPMRLEAGQIVYRVHEWGTPIEKDGELLYLMDDTAILAIVK